jgi:hypothetical protein
LEQLNREGLSGEERPSLFSETILAIYVSPFFGEKCSLFSIKKAGTIFYLFATLADTAQFPPG